MHSRIVIALLVAGGVALACFPRPHESEASPAPARRSSTAAHILASSLALSVSDTAGVEMRLHLTNGTAKALELTFPTGQTHDFYVLDSLGREVWRSSRGRMYTSALQLKSLAVGSTVSYTEHWNGNVMDGAYTAVAELRSSNHPIIQRVEFSLP